MCLAENLCPAIITVNQLGLFTKEEAKAIGGK